MKVRLQEKREKLKQPERGFVTEALEVFNQDGKLVLVCEHVMSCLKKG